MPSFAASISVIFLCNRLLQFFLRCAILYSQRGTRDSGQARYAAFSPRWSFWTGRLPSFSCSSLEPTTAGPYLNFDPYSFPFFSAALRARFLAKGRWAFFCPNFAPKVTGQRLACNTCCSAWVRRVFIKAEKQPEDLKFFPVFGLFAVLWWNRYRRNQAFIVSKIFTSSSSWMMYGTMEYM